MAKSNIIESCKRDAERLVRTAADDAAKAKANKEAADLLASMSADVYAALREKIKEEIESEQATARAEYAEYHAHNQLTPNRRRFRKYY